MSKHGILDRLNEVGVPGIWRCRHCGVEGSHEEVSKIECTEVYEPCPHCGQVEECASDCPGMMAILCGKEAYVVSEDENFQKLCNEQEGGIQ